MLTWTMVSSSKFYFHFILGDFRGKLLKGYLGSFLNLNFSHVVAPSRIDQLRPKRSRKSSNQFEN